MIKKIIISLLFISLTNIYCSDTEILQQLPVKKTVSVVQLMHNVNIISNQVFLRLTQNKNKNLIKQDIEAIDSILKKMLLVTQQRMVHAKQKKNLLCIKLHKRQYKVIILEQKYIEKIINCMNVNGTLFSKKNEKNIKKQFKDFFYVLKKELNY